MRLALVFVAGCAIAPLAAPAGVTVAWSNPSRFTDIGDRSVDPDRVMADLEQHLERLGERYLAGMDVRIEVFDVDRAGRTNNVDAIRVMNGKGDWPCIELAAGRGGETPRRERVCDMNYFRRLPLPYHKDRPLVYEKRMLDEWFRQRFGPTATIQ